MMTVLLLLFDDGCDKGNFGDGVGGCVEGEGGDGVGNGDYVGLTR